MKINKHTGIKISLMILTVFLLSVNVVNAQQGNTTKQDKMIFIDTGNVTGVLKYGEEYFGINSTGLVLEKRVLYFNKSINQSKIKFKIRRPLQKDGKPYPENRIRALATVDKKVIINSWYAPETNNATSTTIATNTSTNGNAKSNGNLPKPEEKSPGFEVLLSALAIAVTVLYKRKEKR